MFIGYWVENMVINLQKMGTSMLLAEEEEK